MLRGKLGKESNGNLPGSEFSITDRLWWQYSTGKWNTGQFSKRNRGCFRGGWNKFRRKTIEIATYLSGDTLSAYKQVIADFESETGVKVTLDEYGDDYESTMKTRMASNDLPDIFETHGWSLIRYKEYLTDLSGEAWASELNNAALWRYQGL